MNILLILLYGYVFVCCRTGAELTSLSDSPCVLELYEKIRNSHAPSDSDPAAYSAQIRRKICKDIFESYWFDYSEGFYLDPDMVNHNRERRIYARAYSQLFSPITGQYTNAYKRRRLFFYGRTYREYSFLCPLMYEDFFLGIVMYAVTKEYDVSAAGQPYKPGRFITPKKFTFGMVFETMLAEEPAFVYIGSSVDVERYYRNVRRHTKPASSNHLDPLCRLISDDEDDPRNQHFRLCTAVLRSADLENIGWPSNDSDICLMREVSFRENKNNVVREGATRKRYSERMTRCQILDSSGDEIHYLYISRGYRSNQLFVYKRDAEDDKIYLVNLSINVSIVDELNSFDFPE